MALDLFKDDKSTESRRMTKSFGTSFSLLFSSIPTTAYRDRKIVWHLSIVSRGSHSFFIIKPTRCTNFTNLFWHETLHVSYSSSVHHQEFIHRTLSNGICHTGL